jgi:protocatechuate 3,4-dioxygenase, beta subunit
MKIILLGSMIGCLLISAALAQQAGKLLGGPCEGCEGLFESLPKQLSWETTIHQPGEPGEPLEISGTIFRADGKTPAPGVILYVYHTNARGLYEPARGATGWTKRHGHLRGWMKTDARGQYKLRTIKPAAYPGDRIPAHIHPTIKEPDKREYYIDEYRFDDDPLLTPQERAREERRGGSGIIKLSKNSSGVWQGRREIVLGRNIPNYQ